MSKYAKSVTEFTDGDMLVSALDSLGYTVEQHQTAQQLNGWIDNSGRAEIIIRKQNLTGAHADIGFRLNGNTGTYTALIDEDDMRQYGYGQQWLNRVKATYREKTMIQTATQRLGLRFVKSSVIEDGRTQLEFLKV